MRIILAVILGLLLVLAARPSQASPLIDAAKQGDVAAIAAALDAGADVNDATEKTTALYEASAAGHLEAVELLIERGADVNQIGRFRKSPLQIAVMKSVDVVKLLLDHGADPNAATSGLAPLHAAADSGCLECAGYLVEAGADVNLLTPDGSPPIHFAKLNGHEDVVEFLLAHGAETLTLPSIAIALANAHPELGEATFREACGACHRSPKEVLHGAAPPLWDIIGRKLGSVAEFEEYSDAMKTHGGSWTYDFLNAFIFSPTRAVPGSKMSFLGLEDEAKRVDIIAYLRTLSDSPPPLPAQ